MRIMSPGILFLGVLAVLFGLVGAYGVKKYMQEEKVEEPVAVVVEPVIRTFSVPMALRDLPEGRTVALGDLTTSQFTQEKLDKMGVAYGYMTRSSQIIGQTLKVPIKKGQPFYPESLYPVGIGPSIADRLEPGQRAFAIPFDGSAAQAGLISPGATVDVLFRTDAASEDRLPETTMTLLENIEVLAVDRAISKGAIPDNGLQGTVALSVTPVQAHALQVVQSRGTLTLVLRSNDESLAADDLAPTTLPELLGVQEPALPTRTEIFRRGHLTTIIHGREGRMVIEESPYGMPVEGRSPTREVSIGTPQPTSDDQAQADCGCGSKGLRSALASQMNLN